MEKKKCKQCGKSFEAKRADSLYCSNNCKQKAHQQRSVEKEQTPEEETHAQIFYYDEFEKAKQTDEFIIYCFYRRALPLKCRIEDINNYFEATFKRFDYFREYAENTRAFKEFTERFLSGEFKVFPNRFIDGKDIYGVENFN